MKYEELIKMLRKHYDEHCPLDRASGICGGILASEAADAIEELEEKAQALAETLYAYEHPWIPVTERLPEKQDKYLCVLKSHNREQSRYQNILIWCDGYFYEDGVGTMRVTHWMPLPEPPKEE